jgi:hypothetical protein
LVVGKALDHRVRCAAGPTKGRVKGGVLPTGSNRAPLFRWSATPREHERRRRWPALLEPSLDEVLLQRVEQRDRARWLAGLVALSSPPTVGDVRGGLGLLSALDLVDSRATRGRWGVSHPFVENLGLRTQECGMITRVWDVLHIAPPPVITRDERERRIQIVDERPTELEA